MARPAEIVVVGAGIAGATIAYELARRGPSVALVEQASIGAGASGRNTGTLLHQVEPAVAAMLRASQESYRGLAAADVDFRFAEREQLLVARDAAQLRATRAKAQVIAGQGVRVREVDGDELRSELAAFGPDVLGGCTLAGVHTLDSEAATRAYAEAARGAGATITTGVRVGQVVTDGGRVRGVLTDAGRIAADAVVVATGPWLTDLVTHAPVRAGRGWLMRTTRLAFELPWIVEEVSWPDQEILGRAAQPIALQDVAAGRLDEPVGEAFVLCPLPDGDALVGASLSTSLRDAVEGAGAPQRIAARALELAPGLAREVRIVRAWSGLRPVTPDGLPLVGPTGIDGLYVHGGHASLGMQAAPATAQWLAALMHGEPTDPTLRELALDRF